MKADIKMPLAPFNTAAVIRHRLEEGGERLWKLDDFADLPFSAVAQAFSRLTRQGIIERLSKGVYYRSRATVFGRSRPNPAMLQKLVAKQTTVFPAGIAAANLLGFTTQTSRRAEVSTTSQSLPRKLLGTEVVVHTRRPAAWATLSEKEAAMLEFLRTKGETSEMSPPDTIGKVLTILGANNEFEALLSVADTEPPRVRAMLGAIGEALGKNPKSLYRLRASLNRFSRFDFGVFIELPHANQWQAKELN